MPTETLINMCCGRSTTVKVKMDGHSDVLSDQVVHKHAATGIVFTCVFLNTYFAL